MERSESNELLLQYAVISLHNALQGTMTLALRNPEITNTWKKPHAKKWTEEEWPVSASVKVRVFAAEWLIAD